MFSSFFSKISIKIIEGKVKVVKGKLSRAITSELNALCKELEIDHGVIWINGAGQITFSRHIAERVHQRFRNILTLGL